MYKYRCQIQTTSSPKWFRPFSSAGKLYFVSCRDFAVFIFPTLLADFKDPIQKQTGSPICGDSHIQLIHPLFFYCNLKEILFLITKFKMPFVLSCATICLSNSRDMTMSDKLIYTPSYK